MSESEQLKEAMLIIRKLILMIDNVTCDAWANGKVADGVDEGTVEATEFFRDLRERYEKIKEEQKNLQLD